MIILLAIPVFIPISLGIKLSSKGSVLFKQPREGLKRTPFICYKFRTLKTNANNEFTPFSVIPKQNITKFGRLLRITGLDELPQLFNVLKGDMSLIGPRPLIKEENDYFEKIIPDYNKRFEIRPGLTGLAQVSGFKGPITSIEFMTGRINADKRYIQEQSLLKDLHILFATVREIFHS